MGDDATSNGPRISVIVVSGGGTLATTLRGLAAQSRKPFEVLVVDRTRSERTGERVRLFNDSNPGIGVRLFEPGASELDAPENAAIAAAEGDVVALTDDSSLPDGEWVRAISVALADSDTDAVTGPVGCRAAKSLVERYLTVGASGEPRTDRTCCEFTLDSDKAQFSNIAVRKTAFEDIEGFDMSVPWEILGSDLVARLCAGGRGVVYDPAVRVSRVFPKTVNAMMGQSLRVGKGDARLLRRHFDQRVQVDVAGRHWSTDNVALRIWVDLDDPDKTLAATLLGLVISPWMAILPVAYLGYLAWSVRQRSFERGLALGWSEVAGMTGLAVLESAARTAGRIRGSFDDSVVCL